MNETMLRVLAERTGCQSSSVDAAISVNNIMLWDRPAGFAELARVLRPGGRLVVTVHRHVLGVEPQLIADEAARAGLAAIQIGVRPRQQANPRWSCSRSGRDRVRPRQHDIDRFRAG